MEFLLIRCFVTLALSLGVTSLDVFELTDVRFTNGDILFGGTVEVFTTNGWERVCYANFNSRIGDTVCQILGFSEGAMSVRPAASLGISVRPLPALGCQINMVDGIETVQCGYANTCDDHAVVTCNYPGYLGCYSHSRRDPSLDDGMFVNYNMTVQVCLTICRHRGFPFAGLAFGQECYCEADRVNVSRKLGNDDCFLPCAGNRLQTCGGGTAAGIYDSRLGSCNDVYTDVEGAIATPGFPGQYIHGEQCTWTVDVPDAENITVSIHSLELYNRDMLTVETSSEGEYVTFTGVPSPTSIQFETSGADLVPGSRLIFTFTGGQINVVFNSTQTSSGAQGVVLTYSATLSQSTDQQPQMNTTTESPTIETTPMVTRPSDVTVQSPTKVTGSQATPPPNQMVTTTSAPEFTGTQATEPSVASSTILPTEEDYGGETMTTQSTVTDEGASHTTPRSISIEARPDDTSPSLAVTIAISTGIILILLLIVTAAVLFTTSCGGDTHKTRQERIAIENAAYSMSPNNDGQADSGIYDPGYETNSEPIYLSIRNDPRAKQLHPMDAAKRGSNRSYESLNRASMDRDASVKTNKTDHDYQSVDGMSRKNTEKSYISIFPENGRPISVGGRVSPIRLPSDSCEIAEDGYMVPTPKCSTQVRITKL